ncbi:hypothetical protein JZK55_17530 [Dissulfurispira thermophila]|uniref:Lipoprotein n=1 Tax=Dissulfurispira thermophila TaxID=2715679 RepID=A0A7G1H3W4_9BACT|nr:hypothetical protein [Dissulfurispira thermophila]BCB96831.1 hypothetical protein JZK55_17530 [Dissulfurispira thermophila]
MNTFLRVLVLGFVVIVLTGCGTLHINHKITGTECMTREDCIKDIGLDKQPQNPDIEFIVTPLLMDEKAKAPLGTPAYNSPVYHGDVELCVANALRKEFKNAKTVFEDKDANNKAIKIKLKKIVAQGVLPVHSYMRIDYDLTAPDGKVYTLYAKTNTEMFWSPNTAATKQYPLVCAILARQVKEILSGVPVDKITNKVEKVE